MSIRALIYAYVLGGLTFIPLLIAAAIAWTIYTSVPVGDPDPTKLAKRDLVQAEKEEENEQAAPPPPSDAAKPRKGWLTVRRTFEEKTTDGSYVNLMRNFLDSRSKDPKRSRPKDMWYVVLKGSVLYLYEDEAMTECEAAIQVPAHEVVIAPEGLQDGELFTKRNAICLKPLGGSNDADMASVTKQMELHDEDVDKKVEEMDATNARKQAEKDTLLEAQRLKKEARAEAFDQSTPWFIFVRSCVDMEDWYLALVHAANYSSQSTLEPVAPVFQPSDMYRLVTHLDDQPDVIPMRWLNALIGRLFFSFYRTETLESYIIGRLMKKLSKVKMPSFLQNVKVTEVTVGNMPPSFSKPMLKELTQEGDAALEIKIAYRGEIRLTVEATAIISLGQRFRSYTVKLVLAVVLRKLDGNLLVKVKRPPTNRIWYAFTQPPEMELAIEPVVSERQIKWGMVLAPIESALRDVINESVVMPNMDDIAFFESSRYQHRGGIWADAKRKERTLDEMLHGNETSSVAAKSPATDSTATGATKSHSVDAVLQPVPTDDSTKPSVSSNPPSALSENLATSSQPSHSRNTSFSSAVAPSEAPEVQSAVAETSNGFLSAGEDRGRTSQTESSTRRARSVPASSSPTVEKNPSSEVNVFDSTEDDDSAQTLSTSAPGTSSMQVPSSSRARSLSSTSGKVFSADPDDGSELSVASRDTGSSKFSNTSSFLASLKSKAVDKQVLSNTAKEAMRKWSANWTGFKKEHMSGFNNAAENAPDSDSAQPQGGLSLFAPARRGNYADIRAAVAGRREKAQVDHNPNASSSSTPRKSYDASDSDVQEGPSTPSRASSFSRSSSPSISAQAANLFRKDLSRAMPSPPKVTTDVHVPEVPQPAAAPAPAPAPGPNPREAFSSPTPPIQAPPIKVQPSQGASMTIPGIHASHRNDVMSMGYAPPQPSPPVTPDAKARTPTIQSMYRLFKTPSGGTAVNGAGSEDANNGAEAAGETVPTLNLGAESTSSRPTTPNRSEESSMSAPSLPAELKRTPPPLPPRSNSKPLTTLATPSEQSASLTQTPLTQETERTGVSSSASEALKLIATQDEESRKAAQNASAEVRKRDSLNLGRNRRSSTFGVDEPDAARIQERERGALNASPEGAGDGVVPATGDKPVKPTPPPLPPRREQSTIA